MGDLISKSGGLGYHIAGMLSSRHQWRPFRLDLAAWLALLQIPQKNLVMIGPSGGYCLETSFFKKFDRVDAYDVDPLAAFFFGRRHKNIRVNWHGEDVLSIEGLKALARPDTCVMFCNLLGQLPLMWEENSVRWKNLSTEIATAFRDMPWISFHERVSFQGTVGRLGPWSSPSPVSISQLLEIFEARPSKGVVADHLTADLANGRPCSYMIWKLTRDRVHIVEAFSSRNF